MITTREPCSFGEIRPSPFVTGRFPGPASPGPEDLGRRPLQLPLRLLHAEEDFGRDFRFLEGEELLTFEEIARLARVFVACGVRKIRIIGGEPLVRGTSSA